MLDWFDCFPPYMAPTWLDGEPFRTTHPVPKGSVPSVLCCHTTPLPATRGRRSGWRRFEGREGIIWYCSIHENLHCSESNGQAKEAQTVNIRNKCHLRYPAPRILVLGVAVPALPSMALFFGAWKLWRLFHVRFRCVCYGTETMHQTITLPCLSCLLRPSLTSPNSS